MVNIIITIDNEIIKEGLTSIIQNGILGSNVVNIDKEDLIKKVQFNNFKLVIIEIRRKNKDDVELMNNLIVQKNKTKIVALINKDLDAKTVELIRTYGVETILNDDKASSITNKIKFNIQFYKNNNSLRKRKIYKYKSINKLSERELEIGIMLIKGISPTKIASKKKIALTTVSTYKTRIYKKLNVNNVIDMATKFNKFQQEFIHD